MSNTFDIFWECGPILGMNLVDIGRLVHQRRQALGLSQARLARMGELSRATINKLETGSLVDHGMCKLIALLDLVGVDLYVGARPPHGQALQLASQTASVSYKSVLDPKMLATELVNGDLPVAITPYVATLLDEAPLSLIVAVVEEVAKASSLSPKAIWNRLLVWTEKLQSPRKAWAR